MTDDHPSKIRALSISKPVWVSVVTALSITLAWGVVRALPGVFNIQTVGKAEQDHARFITKEKYEGDHILIENKVEQLEESDKLYKEQTNKIEEKLDRVIWYMRRKDRDD